MKYYETHKYEIAKKRITTYFYHSLERANRDNGKIIGKMYDLFPFEKYKKKCMYTMCRKFSVNPTSFLLQEFEDATMSAYLYTIGRCSYKEDICEDLIIAYMMKMTRIFFICVINCNTENKKIVHKIKEEKYVENAKRYM
ncbi:MAG: hypothetical protein IJA32_09275 [Lachnospiraceae bacterium]|nr:hypothetical protein [Lachnospiraceae bacterium]